MVSLRFYIFDESIYLISINLIDKVRFKIINLYREPWTNVCGKHIIFFIHQHFGYA